jgi:NitT/TauT family transport system substrate-binding protein
MRHPTWLDPANTSRRRVLTGGLAWSAAAVAASGGLVACEQRAGVANVPRKFKLAASVYVGWVPWMHAAEKGLLKAAGAAHGVDVSLVRGSYVESIDQFMAGHVDAVLMTNVDALAVLPGSGVSADAILIGSYSQGNDAVLERASKPGAAAATAQSLAGAEIGLVENSVSHYLLHRYLQTLKLADSAVKVINVSDADIARVFNAPGSPLRAVVTWNPIVGDLVQRSGAKPLFDSAQTPKEVADMLVVRREVLDEYPAFGRALLKTWFDAMKQLQAPDTRVDTLAALARLSESSVEAYQAQLATTLLVNQPAAALAEMRDPKLMATMQRVEAFVRGRNIIKAPPTGAWASAEGAERKALHFNPGPLAARRW